MDAIFTFDAPPSGQRPKPPSARLTDLKSDATWVLTNQARGWVARPSGRYTSDAEHVQFLTNPDPVPTLPENYNVGSYCYHNMLATDSHLRGIWNQLSRGVRGLPGDAVAAGETPEHQRRRDIVRAVVDAIPDWELQLELLLRGEWVGRAGAELVWTPSHASRYAWGLTLRDLGPDEVQFDQLGRPWYWATPTGTDIRPIVPGQLALYRHEPTRANPHGMGEGRGAWLPYFFKRESVIKLWPWFMTKYGFPTVTIETHVSDRDDININQAEIDKVESDAASIMENTVFSYDVRKFKASLLEATRTGTVTAFESLGNFLNAEMSKQLVGQTLSAQTAERGNMGASELHGDIYHEAVTERARRLEAIISDFFRWIEYYNCGPAPDGKWVRWRIDTKPAMTKKEMSEMLTSAADLGVELGENQVSKALGLPPRATDDKILTRPAPASPFASDGTNPFARNAGASLPPAMRKAMFARGAGGRALTEREQEIDDARRHVEDAGATAMSTELRALAAGFTDRIRQSFP